MKNEIDEIHTGFISSEQLCSTSCTIVDLRFSVRGRRGSSAPPPEAPAPAEAPPALGASLRFPCGFFLRSFRCFSARRYFAFCAHSSSSACPLFSARPMAAPEPPPASEAAPHPQPAPWEFFIRSKLGLLHPQ